MTKTIFRTFKRTGEVIALFPEVPANSTGEFCESYMRVGQHGAASPWLRNNTRPSTREEIEPLKKELEQIGYQIEERKRVSYQMDRKRISKTKLLTK